MAMDPRPILRGNRQEKKTSKTLADSLGTWEYIVNGMLPVSSWEDPPRDQGLCETWSLRNKGAIFKVEWPWSEES